MVALAFSPYVNLLYSGAKESINTSILAGTPDVDIYNVGLAIGAPAVANGYAIDLRDVLPADHPVLNGTDPIMTYINTGDGSVSLLTENDKERYREPDLPRGGGSAEVRAGFEPGATSALSCPSVS